MNPILWDIYIYICIKYPFPRCLQRSHRRPLCRWCDEGPWRAEFLRRCCGMGAILLVVQKSQGQPPGMVLRACKEWENLQYKTLVNHGNFTISTSTGELLPDFWLPSTVSPLEIPRKTGDLRKRRTTLQDPENMTWLKRVGWWNP